MLSWNTEIDTTHRVCRRLGINEAPLIKEDHPILIETEKQLTEYFAGQRTDFNLPLNLTGTDFQKSVWNALLAIPFGHTKTYAELAQAIDHPKATRAVANANGANALPIIVPCHRVIGSDGKLAGYTGGTHIKRILLDIEGVHPPN